MRISLLGESTQELIEELDAAGVEFQHQSFPPGTVVNGGDWLEFAQSSIPWAAIAAALTAWLKSRASRKVVITRNDNVIFQAEGLSVDEVERLLRSSRNVIAADTSGKCSK
jgi:hypothetical protein